MKDLGGRVAVITGGASGIGLATARRLAREGMKLVLADIEPGPLAAAERGIRELGAEALGVATDVGKLADVQALAERAFERFGGVHLLFNNAGVAIGGPIEQMQHADWEWLIRVNLWGVIHGVETFLPRMLAQGPPGHIVSTASFAGLVPNLGLGVYCATKYAVVAISEVLAREIGPRGFGVSVLCPMIVETNINSSDRNRPRELGARREATPPQPAQDPAARGLAGGVLKAEDVAEKVLEAVREDRLYIVTHPESQAFIRRRFERIDKAFS